MKKIIVLLSFLVVTSAFADDGTGYFVGFDVGSAHIKYQPNSFESYNGLPTANKVSNNTGLAGDVYLGYNLYRELGWQVGIIQYKSATFHYNAPSNSMTAKRYDYNFLMRGDYPFSKNINGFVDVGIARVNSRFEASTGSTSNVTAWSPAYGIGVSYNVTNHTAVNTQWLHVNRVNANVRRANVSTPDVPTVNYFSLGMRYRF